MGGRVVVVVGAGTGVGKTALGLAVLGEARRRGARAVGYKPVETGARDRAEDASALAGASTFHVKQPLYAFEPPVSPHLAAAWAGVRIDCARIRRTVAGLRGAADLVLVELAGGLFTPLGPRKDNASLALDLAPATFLAVVCDALGAIHHGRALAIAARARGLPGLHLVLTAPELADASTGHNVAALRPHFLSATVVPRLPKDTVPELDWLLSRLGLGPAPDRARAPTRRPAGRSLRRG